MGEYKKPWLTLDEQADLLIGERGLIADRDQLISHLASVGYYRLSGYWYIFKRSAQTGGSGDERFLEGTTFDEIWKLYTFDRQFRLVVLDAIERVEIYFRTQLAYRLAGETGAFGFEDRDNLPRLGRDEYDEFIGRCTEELERSREPFAIHFRETYGDRHTLPPYWILVNLMDFGTMLRLYNGAPVGIRNDLAGGLGGELPRIEVVAGCYQHHAQHMRAPRPPVEQGHRDQAGHTRQGEAPRVARAVRGAFRQHVRHPDDPELPARAHRPGHVLACPALRPPEQARRRRAWTHGFRRGLGGVPALEALPARVGRREGRGRLRVMPRGLPHG